MTSLFSTTSRTDSEKDQPSKVSKNDSIGDFAVSTSTDLFSFKGLGLCEWISKSTSAMGFRKPTRIQAACIPAILAGRNVIGCAETGRLFPLLLRNEIDFLIFLKAPGRQQHSPCLFYINSPKTHLEFIV